MIDGNKRKKYLWWLLLPLTAIVGVWYAIDPNQPPTREIEQFKQQIAAELPRGTHRDAVEKWLIARGHQPQVAENSKNPRRITGLSVRVPKSNWLSKGEIYLWFEFDDNGRLIKSSVDWYTYTL